MLKRRMLTSTLAAAMLSVLAAPTASADRLVASQEGSNKLFYFDSKFPSRGVRQQAVNGMQPGEHIIGLDVRPADGGLYVVGDSGRLYVVNTRLGHAAQVGPQFPIDLRGRRFGVDFNPAADRLRVVSDADGNYSIDPNTGTVTVQHRLLYADTPRRSPDVAAAAYTNNLNPVAGTRLYVADGGKRSLFWSEPPAAGLLSNRQTLEINLRSVVGMDIDWKNSGFLVNTLAGRSTLYDLDLVTGDVRSRGRIGADRLNGVATLNVASGVAPLVPAA